MSSSLLVMTVVVSFGLSFAGVLLIICCFFFKRRRRRPYEETTQPSTEDGDSVVMEDSVGGKRWHQLHVTRIDKAGDTEFEEIRELPTTGLKNEKSEERVESNGPQRIDREVGIIGTRQCDDQSGLKSTEKTKMGKRNVDHSSSETSKIYRLVDVTLTSEEDNGPGISLGKNSDGEIFVKDIGANGPATKTKRIHRGDRIDSLTISMESLTLEQARSLLDLVKFYPLELHLRKSSSEVDVHSPPPEPEEPIGSISAQECSKNMSMNYLPTVDNDSTESQSRLSSSLNQLPASGGELSTRWRFENQPHIENHEKEVEVGGERGEKLHLEGEYRMDDEKTEDNEESLELKDGQRNAEVESKAGGAFIKHLFKKEMPENFDRKYIEIGSHVANCISNDVARGHERTADVECGGTVSLSLEEENSERTRKPFPNHEQQKTSDTQSNYPRDFGIKSAIDEADNGIAKQNVEIGQEMKSEKTAVGTALGREILADLFHGLTAGGAAETSNGKEEEEDDENECQVSASDRITVTSSVGKTAETKKYEIEDQLLTSKETDSRKQQTLKISSSNVESTSSDSFFDWTRLTLEPLELPWESLGFSSNQSYTTDQGVVRLDTSVSGSETKSSGRETETDRNNNRLNDTSDA